MNRKIDIGADLNAQDDDGRGWSVLGEARRPDNIVPGAFVIAGDEAATAIVRISAIDEDGQVHFEVLPGSVETNRHLLGPTPS